MLSPTYIILHLLLAFTPSVTTDLRATMFYRSPIIYLYANRQSIGLMVFPAVRLPFFHGYASLYSYDGFQV